MQLYMGSHANSGEVIQEGLCSDAMKPSTDQMEMNDIATPTSNNKG